VRATSSVSDVPASVSFASFVLCRSAPALATVAAMENDKTTALVLAGGGGAGIAWELGFIAGARLHGLFLGDVDLIVGTSAGATVGAQLATGRLDEAVAAQLDSESKEIPVALEIEKFRAELAELVTGAAD